MDKDKIEELLTKATDSNSNDILMERIAGQFEKVQATALELLNELEEICLSKINETGDPTRLIAFKVFKILRLRRILLGDKDLPPSVTLDEFRSAGSLL